MQNVHWNYRKLGIYSYQKHVLIVIVATVNSPFFYGLLCPFKMFSRIHNTDPNPHLQNPHMHAHTHACTYTHIYTWPMEINWYYISVWIANSVNYFFFFVRKQLELFMYSYFQAYQAEWLYKNYFLFSSREQSKAIMGLTSEKEYVSWCFCCQWFMNTVHLICHACVDSVQLGYVLLARTLCLGEITFAGLSFPQETELCGCWLAGEMRALLTGRKDVSFVDCQGRWGLCWLAERSELCWLAGEIRALLTGRNLERSELCWLAEKMRALLTGREDEGFVDWQEDGSFVDWQERSELCWLAGEIRALLTDRKDQSFVDWQERWVL